MSCKRKIGLFRSDHTGTVGFEIGVAKIGGQNPGFLTRQLPRGGTTAEEMRADRIELIITFRMIAAPAPISS